MFSALMDRLFKDKPGNDAFAERFIATAHRHGMTAPMTYEADLFRIRVGDGSYFHLFNAHRAYLDAKRGKQQEALDMFVRSLRPVDDGDAGWNALRPLLRPILRSISQLEQVRLHAIETTGWEAPSTLQFRRITEECVELLAVDHPEHTLTKQDGPDPAWGVSLHEALDTARSNLRGLEQVPFLPLAPGLFHAAWQDGYDSSRALLPELVNRIPITGRPVFMLPTRDLFMVAGERDLDAQARMFDLASDAVAAGRAISWELLCYDDEGRIQAFTPASDLLRAKQARLRYALRQDADQMQQQLRRRVHDAQDEDVHVASYLLKEQDGELTSFCSWGNVALASLPQTDMIGFVIPDAESPRVMFVAWEAAMPVIGHLLEPDLRHLHPPRYLTLGYPSADLLERLAVQ